MNFASLRKNLKLSHLTLIKNSRQRWAGFTLIEILVVIVIMAILASIGMVFYSGVGKKTRDARRLKDIQQIKFALEQYRADNFFYPGNIGIVYNSCNTGDWLPSGIETYFKSAVQDPKNQDPYCYYYEASGDHKDYELNALLEIDKSDENDGGNYDTVYEIGTDLTIDPYAPGASPSPSPAVLPSPSPAVSPSPSPGVSPSPSPSVSPSPSPSPSALPNCPPLFRCCVNQISYCEGIPHSEYRCPNPLYTCCQGLCRSGAPTE